MGPDQGGRRHDERVPGPRFFEERDRVGEQRANHREVAEQQWQRILAAGEALESLAALSSSPPVP